MTDEAMLREAAAIIQDIALCVSDADDTRPLLDELPPSLSDRIAAFLDGHGRALPAPAGLDVRTVLAGVFGERAHHYPRTGECQGCRWWDRYDAALARSGQEP